MSMSCCAKMEWLDLLKCCGGVDSGGPKEPCVKWGGLNPPQSGAPLGAVLGQCIDVSHEAAIKIVRINETMSISSRLIMLIPINCYELCYAVSIFQSF